VDNSREILGMISAEPE